MILLYLSHIHITINTRPCTEILILCQFVLFTLPPADLALAWSCAALLLIACRRFAIVGPSSGRNSRPRNREEEASRARGRWCWFITGTIKRLALHVTCNVHSLYSPQTQWPNWNVQTNTFSYLFFHYSVKTVCSREYRADSFRIRNSFSISHDPFLLFFTTLSTNFWSNNGLNSKFFWIFH